MMKKLTIIVFALSIFSILSKAQGSTTAKGPVIKIQEMDVNIGVIPREKLGNITVPIVVFNIGDKPLQIKNVTGICSCFGGYAGPEFVQPGESGTLDVSFYKNKIPTGYAIRTVDIETNDPINEKTTVTFRMTIERNLTDEQLLIITNDLTSVRNNVEALQKDLAKALKLLEENFQQRTTPEMQPDLTIYDINIESSPVLGPKDAPVTIVEFSDLQCPFCIREYPRIKQVMEIYKDKVKLVFKHFPLEFHTKARPAHAAAQMALEQKGAEAFWKMHDMIMAQPDRIDIDDLRGYASDLDMVLGDFDEVMADENKMNKLLSTDMAEAMKCNVNATPTVFINGLKLQNREISEYQKRIDEILAQATAGKTDSNGL